MRYAQAPAVIHAEVGSDLIALAPERAEFYQFNDVARRVWELLSGQPMTNEELVETLLSEYDVDEPRCRAKVTAFLAHAQAKGLVVTLP